MKHALSLIFFLSLLLLVNICFNACGKFELGSAMTTEQFSSVAAVNIPPTPLGETYKGIELPREKVIVPPVPTTCNVTLAQGQDLQAALNQIQGGQTLCLMPGTSFKGNFRLRKNLTNKWITIRAHPSTLLPAENQRIRPDIHTQLPILEADCCDSVLQADAQANYYQVIGLRIRSLANSDYTHYNLVLLYNEEARTEADMLHHFVFDRCYMHGVPGRNIRRSMGINTGWAAVTNSYFSENHERGADSQAIGTWAARGPFLFQNNYFEGAGENVLFGGDAGRYFTPIAQDIEVKSNHFRKRPEWKTLAVPYTVKNLFEIKNAQRVYFEGNILENSWPHAQVGDAILLNGVDGPDSTIEDIIFRNNISINVASFISIAANAYSPQLRPTGRVLFENNVFYAGTEKAGRGITLSPDVHDVTFKNNILFHNLSAFFVIGDVPSSPRIKLFDNIFFYGTYGLMGSGKGSGNETISYYLPEFQMKGNAIAISMQSGATSNLDGIKKSFPSGNLFLNNVDEIGFQDWQNGNFKTANTALKQQTTDGNQAGPDIDLINQVTTGVRSP